MTYTRNYYQYQTVLRKNTIFEIEHNIAQHNRIEMKEHMSNTRTFEYICI